MSGIVYQNLCAQTFPVRFCLPAFAWEHHHKGDPEIYFSGSRLEPFQLLLSPPVYRHPDRTPKFVSQRSCWCYTTMGLGLLQPLASTYIYLIKWLSPFSLGSCSCMIRQIEGQSFRPHLNISYIHRHAFSIWGSGLSPGNQWRTQNLYLPEFIYIFSCMLMTNMHFKNICCY